ncbi:MAG: hypothetical protein QXL46_03295 [Nitrososphaerales archaeon]
MTQSVIREKMEMLMRDASEYPDIVDKIAVAYSQFKTHPRLEEF